MYNCQEYVGECVESLLRQGIAEDVLQIILVDDGSSDGSGRIIDEYSSRYGCVQVIHKPNGGVSTARNAGLDVARGKYLAFVDADDVVADGTYGRICAWLDETGASNARYGYTKAKDKLKAPANFQAGEYRGSATAWSFVVLRELVGDVRFPLDITCGGEDTLYVYESSLRLRDTLQLLVDGSPYFYRTNLASITNTLEHHEHADDMLKLARHIKRLMPQAISVGLKDEAEKRVSYAVTAYMFDNLRMHKDFNYPMLKSEGLMPCRCAWELLKFENTSVKGMLANVVRFFLQFRCVSWALEKTVCRK